MGIRAENYIVLKPLVNLTPEVAKYINIDRASIEKNAHGCLIQYESNFTPMWARDKFVGDCTFDLKEEVAIQHFLGTLQFSEFYMTRAPRADGDGESGHRGGWINHPFRDHPLVLEIEDLYKQATS